MMQEVLRGDPLLPQPGSTAAPATPGPTTGLVLDLLFCLPALLVLARRLVDDIFVLRFGWSHLLMFLLAGWTMASVLWADDKFSALLAASHWSASLVLLWSASQIVNSWLRIRFLAGAAFGLLLVLLVQGYWYRLVELPDLQKGWQEHREDWLRQRNAAPNSREAIQLEKNIASGEVSGFSISRNTYAALLVLLMVVSAGVVIQRMADGDQIGWALCVAAGIGLGLFMLYRYVQSKTAFFTPLLAAMLFWLIRARRDWLARHAKRVYFVGVAGFALLVAAVVGHGLKHGTLVHVSLTFRWQYWVGAARLFLHHPWLGVGWANFGPHYVTYRLPQAAEEPLDPHNFLVRAFVELGTLGGILMLAWMLRLWWEWTVGPASDSRTQAPEQQSPYRAVPFILLVALGAIAINAVAAIDWNQSTSWLFLELFKRLLFWIVLVVGLVAVTMRSLERQELEGRPAAWILYGMLVGLGLFLLHNLIDFSLFEPGVTGIFALLAGGALGMRLPARPPLSYGRTVALAAFIAAGVAWLVAAGAGVVPVAQAESLAQEAESGIRAGNPEMAVQKYIEAFHLVPINAEYAYRAEQAAEFAQGNSRTMRELLDAALAADPSSVRYRRNRAQREIRDGDLAAAWRDYERALVQDPNDLDLRLEYAQQLGQHGAAVQARQQYQKTLELNSKLATDEIKRLSPSQIEQIQRTMRTVGTHDSRLQRGSR